MLSAGGADYSKVAADQEADRHAGTEGSFFKLNLTLARLQKISGQTALIIDLGAQC